VSADENDDGTTERGTADHSRRDFLKGTAAAGAGLAAVAAVPGVAMAAEDDCEPKNPYGSRPGGGISLPEYYKPWPAIKNRNMYLPGTEILPKNEMRITFLGSSPWPPNPLQKGTSMLVELGNGTAQPRGPLAQLVRATGSRSGVSLLPASSLALTFATNSSSPLFVVLRNDRSLAPIALWSRT